MHPARAAPLAVAAALLAAPVAAAPLPSLPAPAGVLAPWAEQVLTAEWEIHQCGGVAPGVSACDLGTRDLSRLFFLGPDYPGVCSACFVGDLQALAQDDVSTLRHQCRVLFVVQAFDFTCRQDGATPAGPAVVSCRALLYRSNPDNQADGGLPGAVGDWACMLVLHRAGA